MMHQILYSDNYCHACLVASTAEIPPQLATFLQLHVAIVAGIMMLPVLNVFFCIYSLLLSEVFVNDMTIVLTHF